MTYRNIKELIKPWSKKDPDLYEALKRLDETSDKMIAFLNKPEFPDLTVGKLTFTADRASILPSVSACTHAARIYRATDQSIPNATVTPITFSDVRFDTSGMFDIALPTRLTARISGLYSVGVSILFEPNEKETRDIRILRNGTQIIALTQIGANHSIGFPTGMTLNCIFDLAQNDYLEVHVFQNSGGPINVTSGEAYSPELWMHKLS